MDKGNDAARDGGGKPGRDGSIQLRVDTSEAEAVLAVLARCAAGEPVANSDWERLFGSEPYRQLKRRQASMGGASRTRSSGGSCWAMS